MNPREPEHYDGGAENGISAFVDRGSLWNRSSAKIAGSALVLLVLVVYLPALGAGFIIDDVRNLPANPTLRTLDGLRQIWFVPGAVQQYYPLVYSMYWGESRLWGGHPAGYHLVNVLAHAANVLLLWRVLLRLRLPGAWLAAAIFAVHPVEVETVAWISERKNVLSLMFALASLLCYLRFAPADGTERPPNATARRWYVAALLLFAAGLMSKTVVVTLPAVLLVIYWWRRGRRVAREVALLLPFFVLALGLGALGLWLEKHHVRAQGADWSLTPVERFLVAGRAIWFHIGKLAWPQPLMFFYPRWIIDNSTWWQYLFPLAALGSLIGLWTGRRRFGRGPMAAVLIYGGVLMPALGFLNVYFHLFSFVADHFQYHSSPALFAMAAAGIATGLSRRTTAIRSAPLNLWAIARVAVAAWLLILSCVSWRAIGPFHDEDTLYRDTIAKNPEAWTAYSNLGVLLREEGRFDEAADSMAEAMRLAPAKYQVQYNYAKLIMARGERDGFRPGDLESAIEQFLAAARTSPHRPEPFMGAGAALLRAKRYTEAAENLDRAIELDGYNVNALYLRGLVLAEQGEIAQAQRLLQRALRVEPNHPELHFSLGLLLAAQEQTRAAADQFAAAVRLQPAYVAAWNQLAGARIKLGQLDHAIECFREVVQLEPDSAQAHANLEKALEQQAGQNRPEELQNNERRVP